MTLIPEELSKSKIQQIEVFSVLWALAHIGHLLRKGMPTESLVWMVFFAALFVLHSPKDVRRLGLLALLQIIFLCVKLPFVDNHLLIMGVINLGISYATLKPLFFKDKNYRVDLNNTFSFIRTSFLLTYSAAAISKLNSGFFESSTSCANTMFIEAFPPIGNLIFRKIPNLGDIFPFFIAGIELILPVLLFSYRTRRTGIIILILFHLIITISPNSPAIVFTLVLLAITSLFLPHSATTHIRNRFQKLNSFSSRPYIGTIILFSISLFLILALSGMFFSFATVLTNRNWLWIVTIALVAAAILIDATFRCSTEQSKPPNFFRVREPIFLFLISLILLNAASPYLGGKTVTSFTMYSNLQTENMTSNHFFIPRVPIATHQDDLVTIKSTSNIELQTISEENRLITWHELRRILSDAPHSSVEYERGGDLFSYKNAHENQELVTTHFFYHRVLAYRNFDPHSATCVW